MFNRILCILLAVTLFGMISVIPTISYGVTQWNVGIPTTGASKSAWPGQVTAQWNIQDTLLSNYRRGENVIYKNSTTLTVTSGEVVVSNLGGTARLFLKDDANTDITTANLDTGSSFSAGTTYYIYASTSSSTASSSTYYISLSSSAPTGPTYYAQLGSFTTDGSGNIVSNKVYSTNYGPVIADSTGQPMVMSAYDYGSSSSSSTLRTGGLKVVYGNTGSLSSCGGTFSITNLPFTNSSSYYIVTTQTDSGTVGEGIVTQSSGSSATITNSCVPSGSNVPHSFNWVGIGI